MESPGATGTPPKNTVSNAKYSPTQVKAIKNAVSTPKATGYKKIKGAVSG
jgi:hypothetical protein